MHRNKLMVNLIAAALILMGHNLPAQKSKKTVQPVTASPAALTLETDLPCSWTLDGVAKGKIQSDESVNVEVTPGPHSIQAVGEDPLDTVKVEFTIEPAAEKIVQLQFIQARAARQDAEDEARKKNQLEQAALSGPTSDEKFTEAVAHFEKREFAVAKPVFSAGCSAGKVEACVYLARIYSDPQGGNYDKFLASALFSKACDKGNTDACTAYRALSPAASAATGQGSAAGTLISQAQELIVKKQFVEARNLLEGPCKEKNANACYLLGEMYEHGRGVAKDRFTARSYYVRSCDAGSNNGCIRVGALDVNNLDSFKDSPYSTR